MTPTMLPPPLPPPASITALLPATLPLTFQPRRGRLLRNALVVLLPLALLSFWLVGRSGSLPRLLWAGRGVFFVPLTLAIVWSALADRLFLELTEAGLAIGDLAGVRRFAWADVEAFGSGQ